MQNKQFTGAGSVECLRKVSGSLLCSQQRHLSPVRYLLLSFLRPRKPILPDPCVPAGTGAAAAW